MPDFDDNGLSGMPPEERAARKEREGRRIDAQRALEESARAVQEEVDRRKNRDRVVYAPDGSIVVNERIRAMAPDFTLVVENYNRMVNEFKTIGRPTNDAMTEGLVAQSEFHAALADHARFDMDLQWTDEERFRLAAATLAARRNQPVWAQIKEAKAWEEYLRHGDAPQEPPIRHEAPPLQPDPRLTGPTVDKTPVRKYPERGRL